MDQENEHEYGIAYHPCEGAVIEVRFPLTPAPFSRQSQKESALIGKSDDAISLNATEESNYRPR